MGEIGTLYGYHSLSEFSLQSKPVKNLSLFWLFVSIWAVSPGYDMGCGDDSVGKAPDVQVWAPM